MILLFDYLINFIPDLSIIYESFDFLISPFILVCLFSFIVYVPSGFNVFVKELEYI